MKTEAHGLARRLTLFDAAMLVMGGIIGSVPGAREGLDDLK